MISGKNIIQYFTCAVLLASAPRLLAAGDEKKSVVFKHVDVPPSSTFHKNSDAGLTLWDAFQLIGKANAGDAMAQHELGLRYLLGDGFTADTAKAVIWIKKAADQNLGTANYNYGLLLNNGTGARWDPFGAYRQFRQAAAKHVPEGQYMLAVFLSDDLAVPRNIREAYRLFDSAAKAGFAPAAEARDDLVAEGWLDNPDSETTAKKNAARADSSGKQGESARDLPPAEVKQLMREALASTRGIQDSSTTTAGLENVVPAMLEAFRSNAELENPEALTLLGWCYQKGINVKRDILRASVAYLRAMRFDPRRPKNFLIDLIRTPDYFPALKAAVGRKDPAALFVWADLTALGLDNQLTERQAFQFMVTAAENGNTEAEIALALFSREGKWMKPDEDRALDLLRQAADAGSHEAKLRLRLLTAFGKDKTTRPDSTSGELRQLAERGSILAQEILGYCYESGISITQDRSAAIRYYRLAAGRGSMVAYHALKRMYDDLRPPEKEYVISE
jgi:TPR repeat protein